MRFVQITDTHIGPSPDFIYHGVYPFATLEKLIDEINHLPFEPTFVLHTGDITDDANEASYALARTAFAKLRYPIYYLIGNHDRPEPMRKALLNQPPSADRYDYQQMIEGFQLAVFDTRGPIDPGGTLTAAQLQTLRDLCTPDGPPLILAIHHQPVLLDSTWLDDRGSNWAPDRHMILDCKDEFQRIIAPARQRLRGVFFGHIHWSFSVLRDGILYCSAASAVAQLQCLPTQDQPQEAEGTLPGYNIITVTADQTIVRHCTFVRPPLEKARDQLWIPRN